MPKFLIEASYNVDGVKGVASKGGTSRAEAIAAAVESVGGSLESFHFALGETDVYVIADLPDAITAVALSLAVNATGSVTTKTTALLTAQEVDAAAERSVEYRAPGS
jgi:uncharacterized protein with GYD domain